ncbi:MULTISPECIES: heat shock protein HspQ [Iodidimonas]|uniref:Heat shock protein HspQ n=1 Tax=Iodidimonas nitroreducens TaxID=1236968 RepID=A0A5A7N935_9PROT|nr:MULTISPECIES: heat shock protein HspQ [Iodidimonas]GAK32977.1 heat shock protein HspQ [alpha proteobacterium Q-1]GER03526.1 DNA-binding protein [Iodidimonas nitroreducens]
MAELPQARFSIGQVVRHRMFGYRGLIFDVDPFFFNTETWYESVKASRPPKDSPWYHVMVDGADHVTFVAERNLIASDDSASPIRHPLVPEFFRNGQYGSYHLRTLPN